MNLLFNELIDARNNFENMIYQMKNTLNDEKLASLIDESMKEELTNVIDEATTWLDNNKAASKEEYESKTKEFQEAMKPLQEKMMAGMNMDGMNMPEEGMPSEEEETSVVFFWVECSGS